VARSQGWTLAGLLAAILVVVVVVATSSGTDGGKAHVAKPPPGSARAAAMFAGIPQHGQALGNPRAPLTLYEFADLKCPICREYTFNVLPMLLQKYVRPGKLRIVFQPQTFVGAPPGDSERAARVALAAGVQNRLWLFGALWYDKHRD
jgi:protein-disulfide isomerase